MTQGGPRARGELCVVAMQPQRFRALAACLYQPKGHSHWHLRRICHFPLFCQGLSTSTNLLHFCFIWASLTYPGLSVQPSFPRTELKLCVKWWLMVLADLFSVWSHKVQSKSYHREKRNGKGNRPSLKLLVHRCVIACLHLLVPDALVPGSPSSLSGNSGPFLKPLSQEGSKIRASVPPANGVRNQWRSLQQGGPSVIEFQENSVLSSCCMAHAFICSPGNTPHLHLGKK